MSYGFKVMVEGDYACFTRPEMKVERVSYDVPTPGALEGMLKSIYWKPAIRYVIDKIIVFNPIDFINIRRNEVKEKVLLSSVKSQMKGKGGDPCIYTAESRSQRAAMILKNVRYGVEFHFELTGLKNDDESQTEADKKHYNIIKRRLENGQCFRTPCLGCSEFPVRSITLVESFDLNQINTSILSSGDVDLGFMTYRVCFEDKGIPLNNDWDNPKFSDKATTQYYRPHMINGVIDVAKYREAMKC
ncbi:MAG: type I-C CRISPR-associated protein Cas5c [Acutalibacteraceae bacterium]